MYKVLSDPSLCFCIRHHVYNFVRVVCVINNVFSTFYDICGLSRWRWILLPTIAHCILTCIYVCTWKNITPSPTCMDAHCQCFNGKRVKSCLKMVSNFLIILCPSWKICLVGLSSGGVQNMTGHVVSVVTWLQDFMHGNCFFFHIGAKCINLTLSWNTSWTKWKHFFYDWLHHALHLATEVDHRHGYNMLSHCHR
jgi:hypothetical protein